MEKNGLLISLIIVSLLLVGSAGFGVWAFMGMQDYRDNVDAKIEVAVDEAEAALTIEKDAEFAEKYKEPNSTYVGPSAYGTITITYPKTWSNYVNTEGSGNLVDGFMHKDYVSSNDKDVNYAFRYQVTRSTYDQEVKKFDSAVKAGRVRASAFTFSKVPTARAIKLDGEVGSNKKQGVMVIAEMRDKTIRIWTEGTDFRADYDKVMESLTFIQ
ncbi:hypothetical protein KC867_03550 [Candidatus Saccharibacteria bacterium]|nr:hypothetical protein [Candidatus Saccharibacteria bacterium]